MISQAQIFSFDAIRVDRDRRTIVFTYHFEYDSSARLTLESKLLLPKPIPETVNADLLENVLHSLHIALGISYWKMYCPRQIIIHTRQLSAAQASFWNTVYTKGLGEFYYRNEIDFRGLVAFPFSDTAKPVATALVDVPDRSLLGIGGGKDSLLSLDLLKKAGKDTTAVVFETNRPFGLITELVRHIDVPAMFVRHTLDERLNSLNKTGLVYNGHVPVSAVNAFLGLLVSAVYGYSYFIVSNEKSANVGNVDYHGMEINHQWSKSEEFEYLFRDYVKDFITGDITYFSLLRSLTEIKIVELFSRLKTYFPYFSSCNTNFSVFGRSPKMRWCGTCAKCAFVFSLFSGFISKNELVHLFGKNLYDDESLVPLYRQLLGIADIKPFDCVGTFEEVALAMHLAHVRGEYAGTPAMLMFENEVEKHKGNFTKMKDELLKIGQRSKLPEKFRNVLPV